MFKRFLFNKEEELMNEIASEKFSLRMIFDALKLSAMVNASESIDM